MNYEEQNIENKYCLCCNEETEKNFLFCRNCYQKVKEIRYQLDENISGYDLKTKYFELKRTTDENIDLNNITLNEFNTNIQTMYAIYEQYSINYENYEELLNGVRNDLISLNANINNRENKEKCLCCTKNNTTYENRYCEKCKEEIFNHSLYQNNKTELKLLRDWTYWIKENIREKDREKHIDINIKLFAIAERITEITGTSGGQILEHTKNIIEELNKEIYRRKQKCKDNHYVRSKSEKNIDNWLYEHKIAHAYEVELRIKGVKYPIYPDFYLPKHNIYIEYWGIENDRNYQGMRDRKEKIYKDNQIKYINIEAKDDEEIEDILEKKLGRFKED